MCTVRCVLCCLPSCFPVCNALWPPPTHAPEVQRNVHCELQLPRPPPCLARTVSRLQLLQRCLRFHVHRVLHLPSPSSLCVAHSAPCAAAAAACPPLPCLQCNVYCKLQLLPSPLQARGTTECIRSAPCAALTDVLLLIQRWAAAYVLCCAESCTRFRQLAAAAAGAAHALKQPLLHAVTVVAVRQARHCFPRQPCLLPGSLLSILHGHVHGMPAP